MHYNIKAFYGIILGDLPSLSFHVTSFIFCKRNISHSMRALAGSVRLMSRRAIIRVAKIFVSQHPQTTAASDAANIFAGFKIDHRCRCAYHQL